MNIARWGCLAILILGLACDVGSVTSPTEQSINPISTSQQNIETVASPATPAPTAKDKLSWGEAKISAGRVCVSVSNETAQAQVVSLLSYDLDGLFEVGKAQSLFSKKIRVLEPGDSLTLCTRLAKCYQWDLLQGDGEAPDPYTPNDNWEHYGFTYLDSDINDDKCQKEECNLDELHRKAARRCGDRGYTVNSVACTFKCREITCEIEDCDPPFAFDPVLCDCVCDTSMLEELAAQCERLLSIDYETCTFECKGG